MTSYGEQHHHAGPGSIEGSLFLNAALGLAGIALPEGASPGERARVLGLALSDILTSRELYADATGAPLDQTTAAYLTFRMRDSVALPEAEAAESEAAAAVRAEVRAKGYLASDMIPDHRMIQLVYDVPGQRRGLRRRELAATTTLCIVPTSPTWTVSRYDDWSKQGGYSGDPKSYETTLKNAYSLTAVTAQHVRDAHYIRRIEARLNDTVEIGRVTIGGMLHFGYGIRCPSKDTATRPARIVATDLKFPGSSLQQAYLGSTQQYPLFTR